MKDTYTIYSGEGLDEEDHSVYFRYRKSSGEEKTVFVHESALAILLMEDIVFANSRKFVHYDGGELEPETVVLFVNCNDLFFWGCADAENVTYSEIQPLFEAFRADGHRGVERWCCLKRGMRPQLPIAEWWRVEGFWDEALEALP